VLVHCGDGISRSPAIVTAYVMVSCNLSNEEAFQYVQARRFCVSPNLSFQHQIEEFEPIYRASLAIANDPAAGRLGDSRRKRPSESEGEDDPYPESVPFLFSLSPAPLTKTRKPPQRPTGKIKRQPWKPSPFALNVNVNVNVGPPFHSRRDNHVC
jgi:hypothetical protein